MGGLAKNIYFQTQELYNEVVKIAEESDRSVSYVVNYAIKKLIAEGKAEEASKESA